MHDIPVYYIGYEDITLELNELFITDGGPVVRWDDLLDSEVVVVVPGSQYTFKLGKVRRRRVRVFRVRLLPADVRHVHRAAVHRRVIRRQLVVVHARIRAVVDLNTSIAEREGVAALRLRRRRGMRLVGSVRVRVEILVWYGILVTKHKRVGMVWGFYSLSINE